MSVGSKANDVISQYYSSIRECLSSRDDASIEVSLRLLCGLMSRGYNLSQFAPLVAQHVVNERDEVEILAQMLMIQLSSSDSDACLQAVNSLYTAMKSPRESRRLRAVKTLTSLNHPDLVQIIDKLLQIGMSDDSQYVRKATLIGSAKLVKLCEQKRPAVKRQLQSALGSADTIVISGAIFACEIINEVQLIVAAADKIWPIMLALDPWTQSRALHHLRSSQKSTRSVVSVLLHSQNASVVIEAAQYFMDEPEVAIQPLIRLLYSPPVISVHAFVALEKIAEKFPDLLIPYASHFLPPQQCEHAEHLAVQILGHLGPKCSPDILLRWALNCGNSFAAHYLGQNNFSEAIKELLERGNRAVAEIASHYASILAKTEAGEALLASLLELDGPRAPVVAVFSDTCRENKELGDAMIKILTEKYNELPREVKTEGALLAARMVDIGGENGGRRLLDMCLSDENQDVQKRAKILDTMVKSDNEKMRKTVWSTRPPPPPSPPVIFIPDFE
ncbi:hypothetical protein TVAG_421690 [Trichomonas vaginalis G3]|uniref:Clathrin/coatomer adaptor adaptin-like N-terminal domain-containing protein n=1 Tax=Trichomonas vaginalis (strain ATCC PRA-98 / G3) TaxID=412133 RepID=A2G4T6_TRIV3|nr:intracellular protein transport [Trichomonas vaginalis G3]EAX87830.1 hypothetical protein TVAG_421690 [Trichomonas vaginalis G3]KAI5488584.1 intracellular protein transport [Trichomonas vaginalis G3]|eukprot:XP_001300760.1 hypothetical protein [Trichomonas vaginalis G3]